MLNGFEGLRDVESRFGECSVFQQREVQRSCQGQKSEVGPDHFPLDASTGLLVNGASQAPAEVSTKRRKDRFRRHGSKVVGEDVSKTREVDLVHSLVGFAADPEKSCEVKPELFVGR